MNRGIDRRVVFRVDQDRVDFGQLLGEAHQRTGVFAHAYCLMDNHFHLVLECPDGGLSEFMHHLTGSVARRWHLRHGGDGPDFRGRFTSRLILDDEYLVSAVRYVHRNPLAFLSPDELLRYRWSSLRAYAGLRRSPPWLQCDTVRTWSGGEDALLRATIGNATAGPRAVSGVHIRGAVAHVIEVADAGPAVARAGTTIALLVADLLAPPAADAAVRDLVPTSPHAAARARRRARQQGAANPTLVQLALEAAELLGLPSPRAMTALTVQGPAGLLGQEDSSDLAPDDRLAS